MHSSSKRILIALALLAAAGLGIFALSNRGSKTNRAANSEPGTAQESTSQSREWSVGMQTNVPIANGTDTPIGWQKYENRNCGFTFNAPADWLVQGPLGESNFQSPEDRITSKEKEEAFMKANPDFVEEGPAPLFEVRSLYIDCFADTRAYIAYYANDLENKSLASSKTIADFYAKGPVKTVGGLTLSLEDQITIDDLVGYEIRRSGKGPDGKTYTDYEILVEKGRVYRIDLGQLPYEQLTPTVKKIIGSLVFP